MDYKSKILKRNEENFAEVSARTVIDLTDAYKDDLRDKGSKDEKEIESLAKEYRDSIIREMVDDYRGDKEAPEPINGDTAKMLWGFEKHEINEADEKIKDRLQDCGVNDINLDGMLEKYQEWIARDVEEMCESYPELQGYITSIRMTELKEGVFACAGPKFDENGFGTEIQLNSKLYAKRGLEGKIINQEIPNWRSETWFAGQGYDAVLKHEIGHILHLRMIAEEHGLDIGNMDRDAYYAVCDDYNRNHLVINMCNDSRMELGINAADMAREISVYGASDWGECFAEAVSEVETRKNPRPFATRVVEKYREEIKSHDDYAT